MVNDVLKELQVNLEKAIDALKKDLGKVRTGRASLSILDGIRVDYYGTPTPLNQVASLNVADPRLITIKPWEKSLIPEIEKTIRSSQLGLNPSSDGEIVRLPMPPLTEERRKELVKLTKKMAEDAKVALRGARRDANEMLKDFQKEKDSTEAEEKQGLNRGQDATDAAVAKGDEIVAAVPPHTLKFYLAAYEGESRYHDLCGTTKFVTPPLAAGKLSAVRDETVFAGVKPVKLTSSAPQAADAVITSAKCYGK